MPRIIAVHRGPIASLNCDEQEPSSEEREAIPSAIRKTAVSEPILAGELGLEGDEFAEVGAHGGPNRALHAFGIEGYLELETLAGRTFPRPIFGENLLIDGFDEHEARVGDRLSAGEAVVEVTMPTERCRKPGLQLGEPRLLKWIIESLRTGFYLRVAVPGRIGPGSELALIDRGPAEWSISRLASGLYREIEDEALLARTLAVPEIAPEWKARLRVIHERRRRKA